MSKNTKKYEVRAYQQLSAPHFEHNQETMSAKMNVLSSPSRNRATGMTSMHEVKSGIFLSDIKGGAGDVNRKKTMKVVRTKSGNFKKAMESELDGEKDFAGDAGTRVTSSYARVLLAGSGFLADAYDLFVINLVLRLLRNEYPEYGAPVLGGVSLHALEGGVAAAALVGSIIGQLVAGTLADVIGRKKIFVTTAVLISIGSFGSACSGNWPQFTVYGQLACWRFLLGLGVGGEYPLAATVTSESSSAAKRGRLMAAVFSMQGVGSLLSVIIVITCLTLGCSDGFTWRFALVFGALPVMIAFPFRLRMHETESFQRVKQEREAQAVLNKETQEVIRLHNIEAPPNYGSTVPQGSPKLHYSSKMKSSKHTTSGQSTQSKETEMMHIVTDCVIQDDYLLNSATNKNSTTKPTSTTNTNANQFFFPAVPTSTDPLLPHTSAKTSTTSTSPKLTLNTTIDPFSPKNITTPVVPTRMSEIHKAFKYYKFHMLGTALCWFLLDVDFYANGLFNHEITSSIFSLPGQRNTALQDAYYTGVLSIIALPGYWLSVQYIDVVGRKNLQMMGFTCMAGLFFICAIAYEWLMDPTGSMYRKYLFLLIYALTFLFSNFGPNTTSFVIPGEIFPAEVRATCHGISAASGKLGAATGAFFFPHLLGPDGATAPTTAGIRLTMLVCGIVAVLGVAVTYLFIPTYDASMLVQEGNYLALDHAFLRPCDDDLMLLDGYECVEIEESDPASTNTSNFYTSSYNNYGASDGATTNETSDFEQGKGILDRSGKYYTASNNPQPMKYVAGSHHDGYNQIESRDELY